MKFRIINQFKRLDKTLVLIVFLISLIGLFSIFFNSYRFSISNFEKQIMFLVMGFLLMIVISYFDWRFLRNNSYFLLFLYAIFLLLLGGLFIFAHSIRGVKAWYKFGFFSFEPISFMELVLIIILAKYFSLRHIELYRIRHIIVSGIYVLLPAVLAFFQPDLGSVIILFALWIFILLVSGITLRHFILLILIFALLFSFGWLFLLKDYQKERIISFLDPHMSLKTSAWNQIQSKIAIGSGGLLGKGIKDNTQTRYGFLPESQTDFIFASFAEETGFLGVFILLLLFLLLFRHLFKIASNQESNFARLFILGFLFWVAIQSFINIGMNLGLLPVIGVPLPFVSYGGSNLIALFIGLGIIQSINIY